MFSKTAKAEDFFSRVIDKLDSFVKRSDISPSTREFI